VTDSPRSHTRILEDTGFQRVITVPHAIALYLGAVIGAGVLILPGTAASLAGPASVLTWGFVCLLGLPLALTFAALASRLPDAGGVSTFATRAFGAQAGAVVGWFYFIAAATGQVIVPLTGAYYAALAFRMGRGGTFLVAITILATVVATNLAGIRVSARVQLLLAAAVALLLALAALVAFPSMSSSSWSPFAPEGLTAAGQAIKLIFFAVFGWEAIAQLSSEFSNPERDVLRATLWSVGLVTFLYVGIAAATVGTHTYGNESGDRVAVAELLGDHVGVAAREIAALMAVLISLATANAFVAATSRLGYALARDGSFPRRFASLAANGVPRRAVLLVGAYAATGMLVSYLAGWEAESLVPVSTSLGLATYLVGTAAGVRILGGRERGVALISLALCAAATPFFGISFVIPVLVAGAALSARAVFSRTRSGSR
jgi:amino acid efflux transporter